MTDWLLLQLTDGAFPSGGFAHSAGLEAMLVLGGLDSAASALARFVGTSLEQTGQLTLPFVRAAAASPVSLAELDARFDVLLPLAGPNQASRTQGRALASAAARVWDAAAELAAHARKSQSSAHHAPIFGALFGTLGIAPEATAAAYLHTTARGILSAAVRLGLTGPLEAQRLLSAEAPRLGAILARTAPIGLDDAAQTAPLLEIFAALHGRLDGRMFQS